MLTNPVKPPMPIFDGNSCAIYGNTGGGLLAAGSTFTTNSQLTHRTEITADCSDQFLSGSRAARWLLVKGCARFCSSKLPNLVTTSFGASADQ